MLCCPLGGLWDCCHRTEHPMLREGQRLSGSLAIANVSPGWNSLSLFLLITAQESHSPTPAVVHCPLFYIWLVGSSGRRATCFQWV